MKQKVERVIKITLKVISYSFTPFVVHGAFSIHFKNHALQFLKFEGVA